MNRFRQYIESELQAAIDMRRLNGDDIPEKTKDEFNALVDSILFDINEVGMDVYDIDEVLNWNLDQNLAHN